MSSRTVIGLVEMYFVFRVLVKELGYVSGYQCGSMSRESKKAYPGCRETSCTRTNNSDTHVVNLKLSSV
jgi:hypothetical protein